MSQQDEHAQAACYSRYHTGLAVVHGFGECLNAFLADAQALGMADDNHLEDDRVHIGPTDI